MTRDSKEPRAAAQLATVVDIAGYVSKAAAKNFFKIAVGSKQRIDMLAMPSSHKELVSGSCHLWRGSDSRNVIPVSRVQSDYGLRNIGTSLFARFRWMLSFGFD